MAFDIAKAIEKLGEAVNSGFSYAERCKKQQSETEIIKDHKKLQKGIDSAEHLILISYRYFNQFSEEDQKEYKKYFKKFWKNN